MKKVLFFILVLSFQCFGQVNSFWQSDVEIAGLKGKVKAVNTNEKNSDEYDENGFLRKSYDSEGCNSVSDFTLIKPILWEPLGSKRNLKVEVDNESICSIQHYIEADYLMDLKNDSQKNTAKKQNFPNTYNYELFFSSSDNRKFRRRRHIAVSKIKFIEVRAKMGKRFAWKKMYYFDQKSRLIEEVFVNYDLEFYSKKFAYNDNDEFPKSIEIYAENNFLYQITNYKYEKVDEKGNWLKRAVVTENVWQNSKIVEKIEERTITYYEDSPVVK